MTEVAIVILNWNGEEFLKKFLPVLIDHTQLSDVEIIVADNDSKDNSLELIEKQFPEIRVIELDRNYGFAEGYNRALKHINAEYFLLLNSDIEVTSGWLYPLVNVLKKNNDVAACSPVLLDYSNRNKYEYAGAAGGYIDKYGYTFCRGRLFSRMEERSPRYTKPIEVFWTTGACMLIRSKAYDEEKGFDPHFFAHMEEVDLCWRLKNKGYRLVVVPESVVYHVGGGTLPKNNPFKTYLNFRNNLFLLYKNYPEAKKDRIIRKRKLLDSLSALLFLSRLHFKDINSIYRAHRDFQKQKKQYTRQSTEKGKSNGFASHPEIYKRSIVVDYFLAGRRQFNKLRDGFGEKMDHRTLN